MKLVACLFFLMVFINCSEKLSPANSTQQTFESVTISKGALYGDGKEGIAKSNRVIKDPKTWEQLLSKMNSVNPVTENFTETSIDFSKFYVIAVFDTVKTTGGHTIEINCNPTPANILVDCKTIGPSGFTTMIMTQPYHIIKIPKTEKNIVFRD